MSGLVGQIILKFQRSSPQYFAISIGYAPPSWLARRLLLKGASGQPGREFMTTSAQRMFSGAAACLLASLFVIGPARAASEQKVCDDLFGGCFVVKGASPHSPGNPFIAGAHPDRRPEGAPKVVGFEKPAAWYERALHGVSEPYPYSLKFLEDQGAWFSPFIHPGMTGRFDIRHWHARVRKAAVKPRPKRRPKARHKRKRKRR